MEKDSLAQLIVWHQEGAHEKIVETIMEIPQLDRDYDVVSYLARAMNNLERYEEALQQLLTIAKLGENDPLWHYRLGYSYFYLKQYEEAVRELEIADKLDPDDDITLKLLYKSRREVERKIERHKQFAAKKAMREQGTDNEFDQNSFEGFDFSDFWDDDDYALKEYVSAPPTDELIASVEQELGYKLPASYITMMKLHNGGTPRNGCFPTEEETSWAEDHIAISGIMGIGREKRYSLCGEIGSQFMIEEWGYPDIGVVICDCPSAGHDVVMLDYRACGRDGEPEVVHVDQGNDYAITFLAYNFEAFIRGLVNEEVYDTSEEDKQEDFRKVSSGRFSSLFSELCDNVTEIDNIEGKIRTICTKIVETKGHFSFHSDELSILMYDLQFWLYTKSYPNTNRKEYLEIYSKMIAFGGEFGQNGYAPAWITDWLDNRIQQNMIVETNSVLRFTDSAIKELVEKLTSQD